MRVDATLVARALPLNFFMADVRDGLDPFLGGFLQQQNWSPAEIGIAMTVGWLAGMPTTTPAGALIDGTRAKRGAMMVAALAIIAARPVTVHACGRAHIRAVAGGVSWIFYPVDLFIRFRALVALLRTRVPRLYW